MGGRGRPDALYLEEDVDARRLSSEDEDFAARAAYCKTKKKLKNEEKGPAKGKKTAMAREGDE